jgi:scyllo-inositol 2-dehydrogenase (NADP+)
LCVNWSDESFRKMSTKISIWGTNGRVTADRQECQIYLREQHASLPDTDKGWTVRYTTELSEEVWYYLRGEEYSAQIDHFVKSIQARRLDGENTFRSALQTDRIVAMILAEGVAAAPAVPLDVPTRRQGWRAKLFG